MINTTELRKGNWVFYKPTNRYKEVLEILTTRIGIKGDEILINSKQVISHVNNFEPIPLSLEILEKAGFEIDSVSVHTFKRFNLVTTETCYDILDGYFEIRSTHNDKAGETVYNHKSKANIKSLHELQNLFHSLTHREILFNSDQNLERSVATDS